MEEFDGVQIILPNANVFGSTMIKFTHRRLKRIKKLQKQTTRQGRMRYKKYLKEIRKILSLEKKVTRYVKEVEILGSVDPELLDDMLDEVFDKYETIFGKRPSYCIDLTRYGRLRILLYVDSDDPVKVLNNIDAFLRDTIFCLYSDEIYEGWEEYKKIAKPIKPDYEVEGK